MSPIMMTVLLNTLRAMPNIATDLEAIAKDAESSDQLPEKIKAILGDLEKLAKLFEDLL